MPLLGVPVAWSDIKFPTTTAGDDDRIFEIPPPEVYSTPIPIDDARLPSGARFLLKAAGWTAWATYSRGPKVHSTHGNFLRMVDVVVVRARLDSGGRAAVACWYDKSFEFAWLLGPRGTMPRRVNSRALHSWIRGE